MPDIPAPPKPTEALTPDLSEQFLDDLARGLTNRFADDRVTDTLTDEEWGVYAAQLVNYELSEISKYENVVFPDSEFNRLAHSYIDACKRQLEATDYATSDTSRMNTEWYQGRLDRAGIIIRFYEEFGLNISQDMIDNFRTPAYSLEDFASELTDLFNDLLIESSEEGITCAIEVSDQETLILKLWIVGSANEAYFASLGDQETLDGYIEGLKEITSQFYDIQSGINDRLAEVGLPVTEVEIHLMNDVSPDKTIAIIKKGQVVYDTVTGLDLRTVGSKLS